MNYNKYYKIIILGSLLLIFIFIFIYNNERTFILNGAIELLTKKSQELFEALKLEESYLDRLIIRKADDQSPSWSDMPIELRVKFVVQLVITLFLFIIILMISSFE